VGIECNTVPLDAIRGFAAPRAAARDLLSLTNSDRYPGADKIWSCASAGEVRGIAVRIWLRRLTFIIGLCCVCLSGLAWKLEKQVPWAAAARSRAGENNEASEMVKERLPSSLVKVSEQLDSDQRHVLRIALFVALLCALVAMEIATTRLIRSRTRPWSLFRPYLVDDLKRKEFYLFAASVTLVCVVGALLALVS